MNMSVIETGNKVNIYTDDTVRVGNKIPAIQLLCRFSKNQGFYLEKFNGFKLNEEKIYGKHEDLVSRIMASYNVFERNLGVILSGDKGIGKTLFAKLLCEMAMENDIPVIICDTYYTGIAEFINSINQNVVILFDEYDKQFTNGKFAAENDGRNDPQSEMLSLFDGVSSCEGKKLFIITCNNTKNVSEYIINRPGRFHYHIRFEYPNDKEIETYLKDKLDEKYWDQISEVKKFSSRVDLNYDCLRSIAFELNNGILFKDAIRYLNIINNNEIYEYTIQLRYTDGTILRRKVNLSLFNDNDCVEIWLPDDRGEAFTHIEFSPSDTKFDYNTAEYSVSKENISIYYDEEFCSSKDKIDRFKNKDIMNLTLKRVYKTDNLHFSTI